MTSRLRLETIYSCKLEGIPGFNNVFNKIPKWNLFANNQISSNSELQNVEELRIMCIQGLYGYRTGLIGKIFNNISMYLSKYNNPIYIQSIFKLFYNTEANDYELLAFLISILTRIIPINNIITFDPKDSLELNNLSYKNVNESQPSIFNLNSLFLLNPIYDSGCAIFSNKSPTECGFEKWNSLNNFETYTNKGLIWCYYESKNKDNGITVITLDFNTNNSDISDIQDLTQLISLKNILEKKYYKDTLIKYETYITGNFNIIFNMSDILSDISDKLLLLKNANINIISSTEEASCEKHIMYSKVEKIEDDSSTFVNTTEIFEEETILYTIREVYKDLEIIIPTGQEEIEIENDKIKEDYFVDIDVDKKVEDCSKSTGSDKSCDSESWDIV